LEINSEPKIDTILYLEISKRFILDKFYSFGYFFLFTDSFDQKQKLSKSKAKIDKNAARYRVRRMIVYY